MSPTELLDVARKGESTTVQFKERLPNSDSLTQEMIAFANTEGGSIVFGINDKSGEIVGLEYSEIQRINQELAHCASQKIFPPITISTETVSYNDRIVVIVTIKEGQHKPYKDKNGSIFMKNGADKRKVTSNEEISRLLQSSKILYADEMTVQGTSFDDIDFDYYKKFIERKFNRSWEDLHVDGEKSLESQYAMSEGKLTIAGLLLFSHRRHTVRPLFSIQCVAVDTIDLVSGTFTDNEPAFEGTIAEVFEQTLKFIGRNIHKIPTGESFNSQAQWEVPYQVFEELIVNALIHRDYFINSTIKIFIFPDRIEIISPGKLPNSLTVEKMKSGISIPRNPILQSLAQYVLPYKGLGTGVVRALSYYPAIEFINETNLDRFKTIIHRRK